MIQPLLFFHGLYGSPEGQKALLVKKHFPECQIPLLPMDLKGRATILESLISTPSLLVGSSLGALSSILFAIKNPELVSGLLLLAPLVGLFEKERCSAEEIEIIYSTYVPRGIPTCIIAAKADEMVPLKDICDFKERCPQKDRIKLIKVADDHRLEKSGGIIIEQVQQLLHNRDI